MRRKYTRQPKGGQTGDRGRNSDPDKWITGPDPITREKYYAWLKHRAQAHFRNEPYMLSWQDWQTLWSDSSFQQRGRRKTDLCLARIDHLGAWSMDNVIVCTRIEYLRRAAEYRNHE